MSEIFPPQARDVSGSETALGVLRAVISGRTAVYVSTPITTGKRFAEWIQARGGQVSNSERYEAEHLREVISHNLAAARPLVNRLRRETGALVIDPTALENISGWTQDDYRAFWARVIELYASKVVFMDGWEYSSGCAYEFLVAVRTQGETLTEKSEPLTATEGLSMMRRAEKELRAFSHGTGFLKQVIHELQSVLSNMAPPRTVL